jgi:hypothetical protein
MTKSAYHCRRILISQSDVLLVFFQAEKRSHLLNWSDMLLTYLSVISQSDVLLVFFLAEKRSHLLGQLI